MLIPNMQLVYANNMYAILRSYNLLNPTQILHWLQCLIDGWNWSAQFKTLGHQTKKSVSLL